MKKIYHIRKGHFSITAGSLSYFLTVFVMVISFSNNYAQTWSTVGSAHFSAAGAYGTSIAVDGSGTPYLAFTDGSVGAGAATVMKYNGSSWVIVGTAGFSAGQVTSPSLHIDGSGTPYVAYQD